MPGTSKEGTPNSLGVRKKWDAPKGGACGTSKGEGEGRGREGMGGSLKVSVGCWLDALGTLEEVPLNRHKN